MAPHPAEIVADKDLPAAALASGLLATLLLLAPSGALAGQARGREKVEAPAGGAPGSYVESISVALVLVPVVVRDSTGHPVTDLSREDFTILDEGEPVPLEAFGLEARPVSVVLALDLSPSMRPHEYPAKGAALEFIRGQREGTAFSLVVFNEGVYLDLDFTVSGREMEAAVAAARLGGDRTALFDAVEASARHLARRDGARIVVLFTDGTDTIYELDEAGKKLIDAIEAALTRDVSVYTVAFGPRAARGILRRVADETGGEALVADTPADLAGAFAHVAESVGNRYLLAFRLPAVKEPGFRSIEVRLSRPDLHVVSRTRYFAR
jgi:VWFA-related protein